MKLDLKKLLAHAGARHLQMYVQEDQLRNNFPCKSLPDIADEPIFKSGISIKFIEILIRLQTCLFELHLKTTMYYILTRQQEPKICPNMQTKHN